MKTRMELYQDAEELLRLLSEYRVLLKPQLYLFFKDMDRGKLDRMLSRLQRLKRLYTDEARQMAAISEDALESPDLSLIRSVWVLLDFMDYTVYHTKAEFPASIFFLTKRQEAYEIICVQEGQEKLINSCFLNESKREVNSDVKRILVADRAAQFSALRIPGAAGYCTVGRTGEITYYQSE